MKKITKQINVYQINKDWYIITTEFKQFVMYYIKTGEHIKFCVGFHLQKGEDEEMFVQGIYDEYMPILKSELDREEQEFIKSLKEE